MSGLMRLKNFAVPQEYVHTCIWILHMPAGQPVLYGWGSTGVIGLHRAVLRKEEKEAKLCMSVICPEFSYGVHTYIGTRCVEQGN